MTACEIADRCGGCPRRGATRAEELSEKAQALVPWLGRSVPIHRIADDGLRDRIDLRWDGAAFGLLDRDGAQVVPIGSCPAASPALSAWILSFCQVPLPIGRAGIRLRVSPSGARGVWIDAANVDLRGLLDQRDWLATWRDADVTVELGQRRKPVRWTDGHPRLERAPALGPWWQTWAGDRATPVWIPVGGFSQPSLAANRVLVARVMAAASATGVTAWDELGAGAGNLTVPLAGLGAVRSIESDPIACDGWRRTTSHLSGVTLDEADLRTAEIRAPAVLADPPRSGLGPAVAAITRANACHLVLVSCATDALARDAAALRAAGWSVADAEGVDQFPRAAAVEWITRWRR